MEVSLTLSESEAQTFGEIFDYDHPFTVEKLEIDRKDISHRMARINENKPKGTQIPVSNNVERRHLEYSEPVEVELDLIVQPDEVEEFFRNLADVIGKEVE